MPRILLIEDEPSLRMLIHDNLHQEGYHVDIAPDGQIGLENFVASTPDLVILDVMLPWKDGFSVAKSIRKFDRTTPILFLTAKSRPKDVVQGFESGGNDYLKKPFGLEELLIRIKVLLTGQRLLASSCSEEATTYKIGQVILDALRRQIQFSTSQAIQLTLRESELLVLLVRNKNTIVPKEEILQKIWQDDSFLNSRSLDVFISRLRKYLKQATSVEIINQRGIGYMIVEYPK